MAGDSQRVECAEGGEQHREQAVQELVESDQWDKSRTAWVSKVLNK